jgi:hypothetical protein
LLRLLVKVFDYVTRRFNASSAGLKKFVGLDLRWKAASAISRYINWRPALAEARSQRRILPYTLSLELITLRKKNLAGLGSEGAARSTGGEFLSFATS